MLKSLAQIGQPPRGIFHIKDPRLPQYRFEWHPQTKKLYLIRVGAKPEIGEVVAFHIATQGDAHNAALIWARGYQEGAAPGPKPNLQL